jgi:transposase
VYDIPEDQKVCGCGAHKVCIGQEVSEKLDITPAQFRVLQQVRPKWACRDCEGVHDLPGRSTITIAPPAPQILPKGIASASLLAYLVVAKFADALPFYRQAVQFERLGSSSWRRLAGHSWPYYGRSY